MSSLTCQEHRHEILPLAMRDPKRWEIVVFKHPIERSRVMVKRLVGLPEETFYRGYLQTRLGAWLGEQNGYLISALIFGLAHVIARTQEHGSEYSAPALVVGAGAFCGALVFGCMLIRTKSLYPSILAHIATNMFASGLVKLALG